MQREKRSRLLTPADVSHGMHAQVRAACGAALHLADETKGALREAHQVLQQRLERRSRPRAGNDHGLGTRDGLQQSVLPGQLRLGDPPSALTGGAFQHCLDLRRQRDQVIPRGILDDKVFEAMAHGLRGMGFGPHAHDDQRRYAVELLQKFKRCRANGLLRHQHDVGPVARQILLGMRQ